MEIGSGAVRISQWKGQEERNCHFSGLALALAMRVGYYRELALHWLAFTEYTWLEYSLHTGLSRPPLGPAYSKAHKHKVLIRQIDIGKLRIVEMDWGGGGGEALR